MKRINPLFIPVIFLFIISCNSAEEIIPEVKADTFKLVMVQHPVADFEDWKSAYIAHDSVRQAYGISSFALGRGTDDPTMVIVFNKINDEAKAREFSTLPELKDAMEKAGVTGSPTFTYLDVIRNDSTKLDQKERVMIAHRVKDFDAWLKVFDEEGGGKRKEFGLMDRGLARSLDDPNMVYIVFAILDKEKATARMSSEELKKIMTDAGVEGPPQFMFYSISE